MSFILDRLIKQKNKKGKKVGKKKTWKIGSTYVKYKLFKGNIDFLQEKKVRT